MTSVDLSNAPKPTVLISGASIAGPALAYWLHRYGWAVTVVEKAGAPRGGGYPIDVRGTAIEVVRRMGMLPRLREAHVATQRFTFIEADGAPVASLRSGPHVEVGGEQDLGGQDLEVARGDLTAALYEAVRDDVEFVFDDSIAALDQTEDEVEVTLRSGGRRTFDLVVGADGMHSHTRKLVFGREEQFHRDLGYRFAVFTMPNVLGLAREVVMWNAPGRAAALYATGGATDEVHAFLNVHRPGRPLDARRDLVAKAYADAGWEVPRIVEAMHEADDLFADAVGQIRMPRWSSGRVALVGDAAYAPSFLTGQGSSLALVGAYVLARSVAAATAAGRDREALASYERDLREFVTRNQALVDRGGAALFPTTARALDERNARLRALTAMPSAAARPEHSALVLPDPGPLVR